MSAEKSSKRSGETIVTSVSVSKEFQKLISQYDLSPTECFRRGVAVTLFDMGVAMYQSEKNENRSKYMHEFLKKVDQDEKLREQFERVVQFEAIINNLNSIKRIIKDLETKDEK
jgi:hypothetical protein